MSIATEIQRIQQAKVDIKNALETKGEIIEDTLLINDYPNIISNTPHVIAGTYTPAENTREFKIEGLPFQPQSVEIICNNAYRADSPNIISVISTKNYRGIISFMGQEGIDVDTGEPQYGFFVTSLSVGTELVLWNENSVTVNISGSSTIGPNGKYPETVFEAGKTYTYFVWGGVKNDEILPN